MSDAVANLIIRINEQILNPLILLLVGAALIVFLWNLVKLLASGDGEEIADAKIGMVWSLVGLVIMVSVIGIMNLIIGTWVSLK